jgi:hypothetical protein
MVKFNFILLQTFLKTIDLSFQYPFASEEFEKINFLWPNDCLSMGKPVKN